MPASSARWRRAVTVAFGLGGITISAWGPRLPGIKADLGIGTGTIGLLLAGVTVGSILGLLGSTPLLHRLGAEVEQPLEKGQRAADVDRVRIEEPLDLQAVRRGDD